MTSRLFTLLSAKPWGHASFTGERARACDAGGRAVDTCAWVSERAAYLTSLGTSRPLKRVMASAKAHSTHRSNGGTKSGGF